MWMRIYYRPILKLIDENPLFFKILLPAGRQRVEEGWVAAEVVVADAKSGLQEHTTMPQYHIATVSQCWFGTAGTYHTNSTPSTPPSHT